MIHSGAPDGFAYLTLIALLVLGSTFLLVWLVTTYAPYLAKPFLPDTSRIASLDGLRGLLALSVVVHHAVNTIVNDKTGYIGPLADNFQNQLGSCAVALFFMLSAYLFCGKIIRNGGSVNAAAFFENRVMRIAPLYYFVLIMVITISLWQQKWQLKVTYLQFGEDIVRTGSFRFLPVYSMNDTWVAHLLAQSWTLRYEWLLYSLIPLLAFGLRRFQSQVLVVTPFILLSVMDTRFAFFGAGAIAVGLSGLRDPIARIFPPLGAAGIVFVLFYQNSCTGWFAAVLLIPFLVAVAQSQGLFSLFATRPLRLIGEVSFSLYLIHNITGFLFRTFTIANWSTLSSPMLYVVGMGWTLSGLLVSLATFKMIEEPAMKLRPWTALLNRLKELSSEPHHR